MLPILLGLVQADDARLSIRATLEAPRLTYTELGAWVQKASGVPILVSPAIRERKATVFVENRPLRETMDRAAEALFLEWQRTKDGYTLRLAPEIAGEETAMAAISAEESRRALRQRLDDLATFAALPKDQLKAEEDKDDAEAIAMDKETDRAQRMRRAELIDRASTLASLRYQGYVRAEGLLLATLTPAQRGSILDGTILYASNHPSAGLLPLPNEAVAALAENYGQVSADKTVLYSIHYDSQKGEIAFAHAIPDGNGASGGGMTDRGDDSVRAREARAASPLGKRLSGWAKADPVLMATRLTPKRAEEPMAKRQTPYKTLADLLVDLHARTGLPIVADGFRLALVAKRLPEGNDVAEWRRSLGNAYANGTSAFLGYQPLVRAQGGWLMMRHPRYWQQIPREVPEAPIRRLEAASRSGRVAFDDVAAFGAAVTAAQEPWLDGDRLVMDAPSAAIAGKVRFLRLWASLPSVLRRTAVTERGLEARSLPSGSYGLFMACLEDRRGSVFGDEKTVPYLLPGGLPLPDDLRLFVNPNATTSNQEYEEFDGEHYGTGWRFPQDGVPGVYATIGALGGPPLQSYGIPLRPSRKLWPDDMTPVPHNG